MISLQKMLGTIGLISSVMTLVSLQKIEGLKHCTNLVELYLYTNKIARIEGLVSLVRLEVLWLNGNRIPAIEVIHKSINISSICSDLH